MVRNLKTTKRTIRPWDSIWQSRCGV